jgi:hypothetical protein
MSNPTFDLDEYVSPLIDGTLPDQGIYTNICDSNCGPAPSQPATEE